MIAIIKLMMEIFTTIRATRFLKRSIERAGGSFSFHGWLKAVHTHIVEYKNQCEQNLHLRNDRFHNDHEDVTDPFLYEQEEDQRFTCFDEVVETIENNLSCLEPNEVIINYDVALDHPVGYKRQVTAIYHVLTHKIRYAVILEYSLRINGFHEVIHVIEDGKKLWLPEFTYGELGELLDAIRFQSSN